MNNKYYSPGRPSFDVGLGGEAERPRGGGVLVLGLESGVRGILGLETKGVSCCGLKRTVYKKVSISPQKQRNTVS